MADEDLTRTRLRRAARDEKGVAVYRLYDWQDQLLYVGISNAPGARFKEHAADKDWWPRVYRSKVEWLQDRPLALKAETDAIWLEQPIYNKDRPYTSNQSRWLLLTRTFPGLLRLERECRAAAASGVRCIWSDILHQLVDTVRGPDLELARTRLDALLPEFCSCEDCWSAERWGD